MRVKKKKEKRLRKNPLAPTEFIRKQPDYCVIPKGAALIHDLMDGRLRFEEMTHGKTPKEFEVMVATAEPGVSCWEGHVQAAGRWYYILHGKIEIIVNDISHVLEEGDSLYVMLDSPHIWRNPCKESARVLMLSSPPLFKVEAPVESSSGA